MRRVLTTTLLAAVCCPAFAQERTADDGWGLIVGAGALHSPTYEGDDESRLSILPNIQVSYGDRFFASVQEGIGYRVIKDPGIEAGPIKHVVDWAAHYQHLWQGRFTRLDAYLQRLQATKEKSHARKPRRQ